MSSTSPRWGRRGQVRVSAGGAATATLPVPAAVAAVASAAAAGTARMKDPPRRNKYFRSRSPVHELLSPKGGSTGERAERLSDDKRWRIQMMIEYTPIPESGEHEPDQEPKEEEETTGSAAPATKTDQMAPPEQGGARPRAGTWSLGHSRHLSGPPGSRQRRKSGDDIVKQAGGAPPTPTAPSPAPTDSPSKKSSLLDSFRPRSKSDATRSMRRPNIISSMKTSIQQHSIVGAGPPAGKAVPPASLPTSPQAADALEPPQRHRARSGSESSKSAMRSVIDRLRGRSQSVVESDKRKFAKSHSTISSASFNANLYRRHDDPYRRRSLSGGDAISDSNRMAILFRDSRGLPAVDPFMDTLHSTDLKEDESQIYIKFFKFHKCYDLIPTSAKLVVFDTQLLVKKAFFALVYNGVRAAPLWDSSKQQYVGMLTITDFIRILQMYYRNSDERIEELEEHKLETWRTVLESDSKPLIFIEPEASLYDAITMLLQNRIHRLPVIDPVSGDVLYIITHKRILRFLCLYLHNLPRPSFLSRTLGELRIGTFDKIETARPDTPVIEALTKFVERRVSALPIVDDDNKLTHIYAKFDVINLAAEKTYNNLNVPLMAANSHRSENKVEACKLSDTLMQVLDKIVHAEVHRLVITDDEQRVIGIISLSDILDALVIRPHEYNTMAESPSESEVDDDERHMIVEEEPGVEEEPVAAAAGIERLTLTDGAGAHKDG
ncbi:5'-AMP-activated protein kinase subunit gamma-2-like isoform X4 [Amphibalanus amphitrite]|uniref:5'-AMP-activated protein kinase subunit gamma-2-like isoform X4 n=1 Tax=Amphibalanus amphitrite TaxID=1232801 RepID=UPI001C8FF541|nr:5'-AMP-activated protein kinase subunit gamma-2-like isoform X4 [Amphibalanus amphitrite]